MKQRLLLLTCAALSAGAAPSALQAQEAEAPPVWVLEPILITARRFEEKLQEAPVAVSVTPEEALSPARAETLESAVTRSPNVHFNAQGGPIAIRGISSLGISGGVDRQPAVGVFVDEVYLARPMGYPTLTEGLERVEVLRGSQATLYGKNTIGGAVNLILPGPDGSQVGSAQIGAGTDGALRGGLSFKTPLAGDFGLAGSVGWAGSDGYVRNLSSGSEVSDMDALTGRLVLEGGFGEASRLRFSLDYNRDASDGGLWYAPMPMALAFEADHDYPAENLVESGGAALRLEHDFGPVLLTSITGLRGHEMDAWLDGDFTAFPMLAQGQTETQQQISQELRLASTDPQATLGWRAGVFLMQEDFEGIQYFEYASVPRDQASRTAFDQTARTGSVFGELRWKPLEDWEVTAGGRLAHERKSTTSEISSPSGTFVFGAPGRAEAEASYSNFSPELAVTRRFGETGMAYGKISRGFKSGGISPYIEADGSANRYDPETSTSFELGWRGASEDGRWTLAATAFHTDWRDLQAVIYTSPVTRVYRNAAEAKTQGVELEAGLQLTPNLRASLGYGYADARYGRFVDEVMGRDYSGDPLPFAPRHSANLGLDWERPLTDDLKLKVSLDYSWRDSHSFTPDNAFRQGPVHLLDAALSLEFGRWSATLYAKNLTDERYLRNYFDWSGTDFGVAAPGRSGGLLLSAKF